MQIYTDRVEYWQHIVQQKSNVLTSKNIIKKKLVIKIGDYLGHFFTHDKAIKKLKIVIKEFEGEKSVAFRLRKYFINEYIRRQAKDYKVSSEAMKKMLQREDKQKELGRISQDICECNTRASHT